jgi:hypothetical protein
MHLMHEGCSPTAKLPPWHNADAFLAIMIAFIVATLLVPLMRNIAPGGAAPSRSH